RGKGRDITEKMGTKLRQYLFNNNTEGKTYNRMEFEYVYKAEKYSRRIIGYGSERDFSEKRINMKNNMIQSQRDELKIKQEPKIPTKLYYIDNENLFSRKEHREDSVLDPYYLTDDDAIILGKNTVKHPFKLNGFIGQSGMSFGSLGDHAIT